GHRFDHRQSERLVQRRKDEAPGETEERHQITPRNYIQESDTIRESKDSHLLQVRSELPSSSSADDEVVSDVVRHAVERLQQIRKVLVRKQVTHEQQEVVGQLVVLLYATKFCRLVDRTERRVDTQIGGTDLFRGKSDGPAEVALHGVRYGEDAVDATQRH